MKKSLNLNYGIAPNPVVLVSSGDYENSNIATIAWAGILNSEPMIVYVSIRKCRYTNEIISRTGEFVINLPSADLVRIVDYCGTKTGKDIDKFSECNLTKGKSKKINTPYIEECKIALECKLKDIKECPSHDVFVAEVINVIADENILDENGMIDFVKANLLTYSSGKYFSNNNEVGHRGIGIGK